MKYLVVLSLVSIATAAKLEKPSLPPNALSASGAEAGLQTPFESTDRRAFINQGSFSSPNTYNPSERYASQAEILRYENEINENGFRYAYETSDGTKAEQEGRVLPGANPEQGSIQVTGSYSYIGDDGHTYTVTYTADENGYQASGDHLPTPPPIPEAILKSLQLVDREGIYSSKKSSYDADAGL